MQIPMKSFQVTVYEWALEFMHRKKYRKKQNLFFSLIRKRIYNFLPFLDSIPFRPYFLLPHYYLWAQPYIVIGRIM